MGSSIFNFNSSPYFSPVLSRVNNIKRRGKHIIFRFSEEKLKILSTFEYLIVQSNYKFRSLFNIWRWYSIGYLSYLTSAVSKKCNVKCKCWYQLQNKALHDKIKLFLWWGIPETVNRNMYFTWSNPHNKIILKHDNKEVTRSLMYVIIKSITSTIWTL